MRTNCETCEKHFVSTELKPLSSFYVAEVLKILINYISVLSCKKVCDKQNGNATQYTVPASIFRIV